MNQCGDRHPGPGGATPEELCIAALIRLAADDELTPEQRDRLDKHLAEHPEDAARIEFERGLRDACARACGPGCCAPQQLRDRVRACCCADAACAAPSRGDRPYALLVFAARFGALAAVVTLVAVMGYLALRPGLNAINPDAPRTLASSLSRFVRAEHDRCADGGPVVESKLTIHDPAKVPGELAAIVGRPVTGRTILDAESAGLDFVDAGLCHPPGGDALHVRFRISGDPAAPLISLWVQAADGQLPIEDGVAYTAGEGDASVLLWRADGLRYVLVTHQPQALAVARAALGCPSTTSHL